MTAPDLPPVELADKLGWTTQPQPDAPDGRHVTVYQHGPHTIITWHWPAGWLDMAYLYRVGHDGEFGEVARTRDHRAVIAWLACHATNGGEVAA